MITRKDEDEHLENLAKVFGFHKNAGLKLKRNRCSQCRRISSVLPNAKKPKK
jgi:hypothetical protein